MDPLWKADARPPSSSTEKWGPHHSVIMEDIDHIFGYKGTLIEFTKFTGIDLVYPGSYYDPADPPTVAVRFGGRDYGVRAEADVAEWDGNSGQVWRIRITSMGLGGSHDPNEPVLQLHVTNWGTDNQGNRYVAAIQIDNPGAGYTAPPIISFTEYGGYSHQDAVLQASLANDGTVAGVEIIFAGSYPRNMGDPPPLPTIVVSDPPTSYDVYPDIIVVDSSDNHSCTAWPTAGGVIQMDDANHRVNVGDLQGRLVFRDVNDAVYQVPGITITGVSGQLVYFTMHLESDPLYYNMDMGNPQANARPPDPPATCWYLRPGSSYATTTPPAAGLGQPGWVKQRGLSAISLSDVGEGYTPGQTYAVSISGGSPDQAATAVGIGQEDGTLRVQITDQGKNYSGTPSVSIASPGGAGHAAVGVAVTCPLESWTVRMYNPWTHGIQAGDPLQVLWKWGSGPWQYRYQCGRYNCTVVTASNGIVTFTGGMNGPSNEPTTQEAGGSDGIAGKAWAIPEEDDYLLLLYPGWPEKDVDVGTAGVSTMFGAVIAVMKGTLDRDFVVYPLKEDQQWFWPGYWGWFTDLNAMARVSN